LDLIREGSDIVIQGSTGGLTTLTREERCVSLNDPRVEVASLNMGSANVGEGVYVNTLPDIRFWAQRMQERQIVPELEVFEGGMISNVPKLQEDGSLTPPFHFNFVLGFEGPLPADPRNLFFLRAMLPKDAHWGVVHDGMTDFSLLAVAIGLGASIVRVGFEDSVYVAPGEVARTNAELVTKVVELVRCLGCDVTTPNEAREIFTIRK
jgi:3-keto-5-aminohexanoate cleavage enzyme